MVRVAEERAGLLSRAGMGRGFSKPKMLLRSASDAGRNGDPAEGGGVEGRAALAEQLRAKDAAGDACRSLPSRGNEPLVIIL